MDTERRLWLHGLRVGDRIAVRPSGNVYTVQRVTWRRIYVGNGMDGYHRDTGEGVTFWTRGGRLEPAPPRSEEGG